MLNEISFSQFDISLRSVGGFPNLKNPRVIWVGIEEDGAERLTNLANEIGTKLTNIGLDQLGLHCLLVWLMIVAWMFAMYG